MAERQRAEQNYCGSRARAIARARANQSNQINQFKTCIKDKQTNKQTHKQTHSWRQLSFG